MPYECKDATSIAGNPAFGNITPAPVLSSTPHLPFLFLCSYNGSLASALDRDMPHSQILILSYSNRQYEKLLPEFAGKMTLILPKGRMEKDEKEKRKKGFSSIIEISPYFNSAQLEKIAYEILEKEKIGRVVALDEFDLLRAARLRDMFSLPGQTYKSAVAFRDKLVMKSILQQKGIAVPEFAPLASGLDLIEFTQQHGLPVVVKPRRGCAAEGVRVLSLKEELNKFVSDENFFDEYHQASLMVEKFVTGSVFHIDGLIIEGKMVACWPSIYMTPPIDIFDKRPVVSYTLAAENPLVSKLINHCSKVLAALPTPDNTAFHLEAFLHNDGIVFCEAASRVGCAGINSMWKESFGINLEETFCRLQGDSTSAAEVKEYVSTLPMKPAPLSGCIVFPATQGVITSIPNKCPLPFARK